jgi:hypothetical protein
MARRRREREELDYFRFDAVAWLSSPEVVAMNPAQRGAFIHLLAIAARTKHCNLPDDVEKLKAMAGLVGQWETLAPFDLVRAQFESDPEHPGRIYNRKLRKEWTAAWEGYLARKDRNSRYRGKEAAQGNGLSGSEPPSESPIDKDGDASGHDVRRLEGVSPLTGAVEGTGTGAERSLRELTAAAAAGPPAHREADAPPPRQTASPFLSGGRRAETDREMLELVERISKAEGSGPEAVWTDACTGEGRAPGALKARPSDLTDEAALRTLAYLRDRARRSCPPEARPAWEPDPAAEEVLGRVLDRLRADPKVPAHSWATWFRPWVGVGWNGAILRVHVPDAHNVEWIQKGFADQLHAALEAEGLSEPQLAFEYDRAPPARAAPKPVELTKGPNGQAGTRAAGGARR